MDLQDLLENSNALITQKFLQQKYGNIQEESPLKSLSQIKLL